MKTRAREVSFDSVADIYELAEYCSLGLLLQHARTHFLPVLDDRKEAFVLGDGDGRFLSTLMRRNQHVKATAVDTSARMLAQLEKRCAPMCSRLRAIRCSAEAVQPDASTDLIVTHFFLDCLSQKEVEKLTRRCSESCRTGTLWLISDFQVPQGRFLRAVGELYIRLLYVVFGILTGLQIRHLPDARRALRTSGFQRIACHTSLFGLLYTELWQLVRREEPLSRDS